MRILHIIPSLRKGGAERLALDICCELQKREDVEVCLIALSNENQYQDLSSKIHFKIIPSTYVPSLTGKAKIDVDDLLLFIKAFQPEVIHSHLFQADLVSRFKVFPNVKYFSHCHDNMHQLRRFSLKTLFDKKLLTEFYERQIILKKYIESKNSFIAISKHAADYFKAVLPSNFSNRIHQIHNAIQFEVFNKVNAKRSLESVRLVNVGSFVSKKNQLFLPEIVKALRDAGVNTSLTMLGDGPFRSEVQAKVNALGLTEYVSMPGNVDDVPVYLAEANVYAHTATYEPFGLVLIEAMAAGLPVVCLDGGGNRDVMEQGKNGFILNEQNGEKFAETIRSLIESEEYYCSISTYAVEFARRYDIKPYVDKLLQLYAA